LCYAHCAILVKILHSINCLGLAILFFVLKTISICGKYGVVEIFLKIWGGILKVHTVMSPNYTKEIHFLNIKLPTKVKILVKKRIIM
jgi:hypothetical protein